MRHAETQRQAQAPGSQEPRPLRARTGSRNARAAASTSAMVLHGSPGLPEEGEVGEVLHAGRGRRPWERVRVHLLGDVGLDGIEQEFGRGDPREREELVAVSDPLIVSLPALLVMVQLL